MKTLYLLLIFPIAIGNYVSVAEVGTPPWQPVGRYAYPPIRESSGIVASRQFEGVYWTLNDSGNPAALYATRLNGELIQEITVQGSGNFDWEALGIDEKNHLWIGEIGNNSRLRMDLKVVVVAEPNPFTDTDAEVIASYPYRYPNENVDAEGLFIADGLPYIVSKERERAVLYRFPTLQVDTKQVLARVGEFTEAKWVTGAGLSNDGTRLAVCTYDALWVYHGVAGNLAQLIQGQPWGLPHDFRGEAVCFDGYNLVLTNEARDIYALPQFWYEKAWELPPNNTLSAVSLLAGTKSDEFEVESYREAGIDIGGRHVALNANAPGAAVYQQLEAPYENLYKISVILTRGPEYGQVELSVNGTVLGQLYDCYHPERIAGTLVTFGTTPLNAGNNQMMLRVLGKAAEAAGYKIGLDSYHVLHASPYVERYMVVGAFPRTDINTINEPFPPEKEHNLRKDGFGKHPDRNGYEGIEGKPIRWREASVEADGMLDLRKNISSDPIAVGYALTYVYAPKAMPTHMLLGSDDAVAVWLNGTEIHRNDVSRPAIPDEDTVSCHLNAGWNEVLCKVGQNGWTWGLYLRFTDADGVLKYAIQPRE